MTNSFIGQVGDVNNHKQDFEKLHVCFCVFKNRCLLAQLRGGEGGKWRGREKGRWLVGWMGGGQEGQEKNKHEEKKREHEIFLRSDWKHNVALSTSSQTNPVQLKLGTDRH